MTLLEPGQPAEIKIRGLRLLPIVIPGDGDVGPIAALLNDKALRERAREALEETGNAASRAALRHHLAQAGTDPQFTCAVLNSLGRLHDRGKSCVDQRADPERRPEGPRRRGPRTRVDRRPDIPRERAFRRGRPQTPRRGPNALDANLRLLNNMESQPTHREAALAGYRELLASAQGPVKDGALAGLGRVGNASCVVANPGGDSRFAAADLAGRHERPPGLARRRCHRSPDR